MPSRSPARSAPAPKAADRVIGWVIVGGLMLGTVLAVCGADGVLSSLDNRGRARTEVAKAEQLAQQPAHVAGSSPLTELA